MSVPLSRRDVLSTGLRGGGLLLAAGLVPVALPGCGGSGSSPPPSPTGGPYYVFKLSGRGRRISNAAKAHDANLLFATFAAANANRAHPGDTSKVVRFPTSEARWLALFGSGRAIVDLRAP